VNLGCFERTRVHRVLKGASFIAYIPHLLRALNGYIDCRTDVIGWLVVKQAQAERFVNGIVWPDEAFFQFVA
jgi:hypothetical protein